MFVCVQVQELISTEVQSALKQSDKMMKALMERIQEVDNEPRYEARIRKLEVSEHVHHKPCVQNS